MAQSVELKASRKAATESFEKVIADFCELSTKFDDLVSSGSASIDRPRNLRDEANLKINAAKSLVKDTAVEAKDGMMQAVRHAAISCDDMYAIILG